MECLYWTLTSTYKVQNKEYKWPIAFIQGFKSTRLFWSRDLILVINQLNQLMTVYPEILILKLFLYL